MLPPYLVPGVLVAGGVAALAYALFSKPSAAAHAAPTRATAPRTPTGSAYAVPTLPVDMQRNLAHVTANNAMLSAANMSFARDNALVSGDPTMSRYLARKRAIGCIMGR